MENPSRVPKGKAVGISMLAAGLLYFILAPMFWQAPQASLQIPRSAPCAADLNFSVQVSSWHPNFRLGLIRFFVDNYGSTGVDPDKPFYALIIYNGDSDRTEDGWPSLRLNRWSWPRTRALELSVPLAELHAQGIVHSGILKGHVDVDVTYPRMNDARTLRMGWMNSETHSEQIPFEILLN